jgi:predicted Rossmann-fold nucleotide-binding protein
MTETRISTQVTPEENLNVLSQAEMSKLLSTSQGGLYDLFRRCSLAVLNCGSDIDDPKQILEQYQDFDIRVIQQERGIKLALTNAPASAFVDGTMIRGIKNHLFSVLRDTVYVNNLLADRHRFDLNTSAGITNFVFHILRNGGLLKPMNHPNLVVCWGGHAISLEEYCYTKEVGYQLGLRGLNICTGCGPGAMKGPMKGAAIAHTKQRVADRRYIGISEPGIIAAESPNPIVSHLVILPDIEKRLEAFIRIGHGFIVFPGGVGTAEEVLYLLGILLHPDNQSIPFPLVLTGPSSSQGYFDQLDHFIRHTLGEQATGLYQIIIGDATKVARFIKEKLTVVRAYRKQTSDAFYYNWLLNIEYDFQQPFTPSHEQMAALALHQQQGTHSLAVNLRRLFSGIVSGNVKEAGIRQIEQQGPFAIQADTKLMELLDHLLTFFVKQQRMKIPGASSYVPCYYLVDQKSG